MTWSDSPEVYDLVNPETIEQYHIFIDRGWNCFLLDGKYWCEEPAK